MSDTIEPVEEFRARARAWIKANLGPVQPRDLTQFCESDEAEVEAVARDRALQRKLFDGGFGGICFPKEYGGQGLTVEHQRAFNEELAGHEFPSRFVCPTISPCAMVLLEFGTHEQKLRHIPPILKGDAFWVQMLSEPGGGSDVAGSTTSAVRDGDDWLINGSKVWTSRAYWADWGLLLGRTNINAAKHQGLTVFMVPLNAPGLEVHRIERLNGESEACQEFFTDVRVPDAQRLGEIDDGWTVGTRWMYYERLGHNAPQATRPIGLAKASGSDGPSMAGIARKSGRIDDLGAQEMIGEARELEIVGHALSKRLAEGRASGKSNVDKSSIDRVFRGTAAVRRATIAFDLAGTDALVWDEDEGTGEGLPGMRFLVRQVACIGGGTTEISRNVLAERVLGMPREASGDKGVPFRDIPRGPSRSG